MKVAELQSFLESLAMPLDVSGGKSCAAELRRAVAGLGPFSELTVAQFADFLATADTYARTGVVPATGGKGRQAKGPAVDREKVLAASQQLLTLYEQALDASVTFDAIASTVKKLGSKLNKDETLETAKEIGIAGTLKSKKQALEEIERKIVQRKESLQRVSF